MTEFMPLYAQVEAQLVRRLSQGEWAPGAAIPSEIALAGEIGVSQGTVRKAIDRLCASGALVRAQGKGTFVAEQTPELANFRFFRMVDPAGERVVPKLLRQIAAVHPANAAQAAGLQLPAQTPVHVIDRVRLVGERRVILETAAIPEALMPGLSDDVPLPNALYPHYQARYGISVLRTDENLFAVNADARQARRLSIEEGTALLAVRRIAYDLTGCPVEYRESYFVSDGLSFAVSLG